MARRSPDQSRRRLQRVLRVLGRRLRALRREHGWSQRRAAAEAGVSVALLGRLERGEGKPSLSVLVGLARALGLALDDLLDH